MIFKFFYLFEFIKIRIILTFLQKKTDISGPKKSKKKFDP